MPIAQRIRRLFPIPLLFLASTLAAQDSGEGQVSAVPADFSFHFQATTVTQMHPGFRAPYSGQNSLSPDSEHETTITSTLFLGAHLWEGAELYVDPELSGGSGLSRAFGVAGFPNGEAFRVGSPEPHVFLARAMLRQTFAAGSETEVVRDEQNQVAGVRPVRRWTVTVGKFGISDFFDDNDYSHDPRTQFLNWGDWTAGAWDYPADTRGYTWGVVLEYFCSPWSFHFAAAAEPREANGLAIDHHLGQAHSWTGEIDRTFQIASQDGIARVIVFENKARMGNYEDAIREAGDGPPDVTATRRPGRTKWGAVVNLQQSLGSEAGLFVRGSFNDGRNESWAYAEIDRSATAGAVRKAPLPSRPLDEAGLAVVVNGLSAPHRDYLAAGGYGFMLGDGRLRYGLEEIGELYYQVAVVRGVRFTADYQFVRNPAYNRDRGPVHVFGLRLHAEI